MVVRIPVVEVTAGFDVAVEAVDEGGGGGVGEASEEGRVDFEIEEGTSDVANVDAEIDGSTDAVVVG